MKKEKKSIYELLEEDIMGSDLSLGEKNEKLSRLIKIRSKKVNILFAGATGSGKSSTINALFNTDVARVGVGVDPETHRLDRYELENLVIWDSPGMGDGLENDDCYSRMLVEKLSETDGEGAPLIDLVLVVIDASTKDLKTTYEMINDVIVPCLGQEAESRLLIGLNQADMAMKGTHWLTEENAPDDILIDFLQQKAQSVQRRILEGTGLHIRPICYCAGYKEEGGEQRMPYNLTKLLYHIVMAIPGEKRLALADNINDDADMWTFDDQEEDYKEKTRRGFFQCIGDYITLCAERGKYRGEDLFGLPGRILGSVLGGMYGIAKGASEALFE